MVEPLVGVLPTLGAAPEPVGGDQLDGAPSPGLIDLHGPELGSDDVGRVFGDSERVCR